jgi:hypothetical protein
MPHPSDTLIRLAVVEPPAPPPGSIAAEIGIDPSATELPTEVGMLLEHGRLYLARALGVILMLAALVACGSYHTAVVPAAQVEPQAAVICVDGNGVRVPDAYCPIGYQDGLANAGYVHEFYPYPSSGDVVLPYVGYRATGNGWTRSRPVNITTINIHPGSDIAPATAPAGSKATSADVPVRNGSTASGSSSVTRGGLGVGANARSISQASAGSYTPPKPGPIKRVIAAVKAKVGR